MVKIYNLCYEPNYQYEQKDVPKCSLATDFQFKDHQVTSLQKVFNFCLDAALFLQRMEHYHRDYFQDHFNETQKKPSLEKQPVVVVHCKAGKGRTGMMICSLLLFLGLFDSSEAAIDHYNKVRAINGKALTICSQKRYVHFFEGFLKYKLQESTTDNAVK